MEKGNWVAIDKKLSSSFSEIRREYSKIEAMFSLSLDVNCGKQRSEASYSRMWSWSRGKVKRFIKTAKENGQETDRERTGNGHAYSLLYKEIQNTTDRQRTGDGQGADTKYKEQEQEQEKTTTVEQKKKLNGTPYKEIVDFLNSTAEKNYKHTAKATQGYIKARFNEGFTLEDFKTVIESKVKEWQFDNEMVQYIRPSTLFGTKFEGYLQASEVTKSKGIHGDWV